MEHSTRVLQLRFAKRQKKKKINSTPVKEINSTEMVWLFTAGGEKVRAGGAMQGNYTSYEMVDTHIAAYVYSVHKNYIVLLQLRSHSMQKVLHT